MSLDARAALRIYIRETRMSPEELAEIERLEAAKHYTVEFDEREGWLVITDPGGASAIVAENVAPWFGHFVVRVVGPVPNLWDARPVGVRE